MAGFGLIIAAGFDRDLQRIQKAGRRDVVHRILIALPRLKEDPTSSRPGLDIARLKTTAGTFRLRIGAYRVLYEVDIATKTVVVTTAYHRSRSYRV